MNRPIRSAAIRTKLQEMTESIDMVQDHLPDSAGAFLCRRGCGRERP